MRSLSRRAILATVAIYRAGESSKPWAPLTGLAGRAANPEKEQP